ncbi:MAG: hypothetical protein AAB316_19955, partial [Bacteroidota bacterium]
MKLILFFTFCVSFTTAFCQTLTPEQKAARNNLRDALKMQLPLTFPEKKGNREFKKSYSTDASWDAASQDFIWELPEKLHDTNTDTLVGGGKYYLPTGAVDGAGISKVFNADSTRLSILIKVKLPASFTFRTYGNEPDKSLQAVELGTWDRRQEKTVDRAIGY